MSIKGRLCGPTFVTKLNNKYFIVENGHHRIIYTDDISNEIKDWNIVDYEFAGLHSIASDGDIYVIENTGRHEVIVLNSDLKFKQQIINVGIRPHRTRYDSITQSFYVISSGTQEIFCFKKNTHGLLYIDYSKKLDFLDNVYIRSFAIIDGYMYFTGSNGFIVKANYIDSSFSVVEKYTVPNEIVGMNDISKVGDYYYLTSTQSNTEVSPRIIRTKDLSTLDAKTYEDIYNKFGFRAAPYFIDVFDNKIYIGEIGTVYNGVFSAEVNDINLDNVIINFKFDEVTEESTKRHDMYPG